MADLALGYMKLYSALLHRGMSRGCPSYPSCSRYMTQAVIQFGGPVGIVLGLERLLHETGEIHHGTAVSTPHGLKVYDPLDSNTFWWHNSQHE